MDDTVKQQIETATRIAFERYAERHPTLAVHLKDSETSLLASAMKEIKDDPELAQALQTAKTENNLLKLIEVAENHLPRLIGLL
jgi:hypothetical protein